VDSHYDAIVVGAHCAGSQTAMLLARRGYRVLLVDRVTFPSDTISTLLITPPGVAALHRWGLLDAVVATGCPPIEGYLFDFGPTVIAGTPYPCDRISTLYAPRRTRLDTVLVEAAARAGAEVRTGFAVDEVLIDDGVVVGVRGHDSAGRSVTERTRVVVGANGENSIVARAVSAARYHDRPVLETAWGQWRGNCAADPAADSCRRSAHRRRRSAGSRRSGSRDPRRGRRAGRAAARGRRRRTHPAARAPVGGRSATAKRDATYRASPIGTFAS
jgi:2-polyprenyl-6-methoxyphenol hydroxylase-like FAD-dependent oxidoreductase